MMRMQLVAMVFGLTVLAAPAWAADPITGRWVTGEKDAVVTIANCGGAGSKRSLCGRIERFLIMPAGGNDQRDVNNADAAKRNRKLIGTAILTGLTSDGTAWRGQVYDPKSGRTYTSEVRRTNSATLEVKGCFGPICQTQVWKKAS